MQYAVIDSKLHHPLKLLLPQSVVTIAGQMESGFQTFSDLER